LDKNEDQQGITFHWIRTGPKRGKIPLDKNNQRYLILAKQVVDIGEVCFLLAEIN
jgi:hypothetical protein